MTNQSSRMANAFSEADLAALSAEERVLIERRLKVLGRPYKLFYQRPVHAVRASDVWIYDAEGEQLLDAYNNVPCVGHCHPAVVQAIATQAATLNTHTRYLDDRILDYAERLLRTFPGALDRIMFACSGSEAMDLAIRIARIATGGDGLLITENAYHGTTTVTAGISPCVSGFEESSNVVRVAVPDVYRQGAANATEAFRQNVAAGLAQLKQRGHKPCAVIFDGIFATDGIAIDPTGFTAKAIDLARAEGALYIADEVQPGFGRTGSSMWGFQRHGVTPDMVVLGKPIGNGMPIAATVMRASIQDAFSERSRYFNTFAGTHVSIAAASAVLDIIESENLIWNCKTVGDYMMESLRHLRARHDVIGDVRGAGLYIGVEIVESQASKVAAPDLASRLVNALREANVLVSLEGRAQNVIKIRPPMTFKRTHADILTERLSDALSACRG
jgi:4-aminobutyrate aminotransferase-like enzyme